MRRSLLFWLRPRIGVIELHGVLASRTDALNVRALAPLIERAFRDAGRGGHVILDIDSPGGSPVQSELIAALIRRQADKHDVQVIAVIQEVGASGGYWLACAADEILANAMSVVGSIGVVGGGFGLSELIARLGVERRLYTAGEHKARLDPFSPERAEDVTFVRDVMTDLHTRFKEWVRTRRGERLRGTDAVLFDGSWFLGDRARALGLIDDFGDRDLLVHRLGGERAVARVYRPRRGGLLRRLPRLAAAALIDSASEALAERAWRLSLISAPPWLAAPLGGTPRSRATGPDATGPDASGMKRASTDQRSVSASPNEPA